MAARIICEGIFFEVCAAYNFVRLFYGKACADSLPQVEMVDAAA